MLYNVVLISIILYYVIFLNSHAKITLLFDTSKQFITFLIEMITNSYNLIVFLPKNVNPVQEFGEKACF